MLLCKRTVSPIRLILNAEHAVLDVKTPITFEVFEEYSLELESSQEDPQKL